MLRTREYVLRITGNTGQRLKVRVQYLFEHFYTRSIEDGLDTQF